jgi:hypothetical protein
MVRVCFKILVFGLVLFFCMAEAMNTTMPMRIVATLRTIVRRPRSPLDIGKPTVTWRLFNVCSHSFVQSFLRTVNALGRGDDICLSKLSLQRFNLFSLFHCMDASSGRNDCPPKCAIQSLFMLKRTTTLDYPGEILIKKRGITIRAIPAISVHLLTPVFP